MSLLQLLRTKPKLPGITESQFSCQRDGLTIRGTEYRPEGDHLPIAIVSHGFMANRNSVREYTQLLADKGYAAYCFDFCGGCLRGGKSDGKTTEMSVLTEVKDLEAVIRYTRSLPYTSNKLLLMGASQGGMVSALTAAKPENDVGKLVLFYPAFCIPDDARAGKMMFAKFDPNNIPQRINCGPMKLGKCYPTDVIEMDPFLEIQGYKGPVLIVHGTNDRIVSIDYAQKAQAAYGDACTLKIIPNAGHGFSKEHDQLAKSYLREFA